MKLPVVRYSPVGAVLLTCSLCTQYALVTTLASHATLYEMAIVPASSSVFGGISPPAGFLMITLEAP
uniref:Putative secreted peptide n=1 Tax=Anopheles braziliensis TaxID=58242 RepID=A0A2M3ZW61_9DIPT